MIAASQFHQRGNTIGNWYDRYTVRSNVQGHPTNWLKVGLNVNFSYDRRNNNGNWGDGSNAGGNNYLSGGLSMILNPLYPAIDPVTGSVYEKEFAVYAGAINPKYQDKNTKLDPDKDANSYEGNCLMPTIESHNFTPASNYLIMKDNKFHTMSGSGKVPACKAVFSLVKAKGK